jgi:O-acetyl-ADP-ribose deacetylase (regulator of RNase III)
MSLPALGTGVAGVPIDECAGTMLPIAAEIAESAWQELKEIRFVLWTEQDMQVFRRVLEGL